MLVLLSVETINSLCAPYSDGVQLSDTVPVFILILFLSVTSKPGCVESDIYQQHDRDETC